MIDFLRNLTRTRSERLDERLSEYLDGTLSPRARRQVEEALAQDPQLREELRQMRAVREAMRRLPRHRAPRSFALTPEQVGALEQSPAWSLYPALRTATVVATLLLATLLVFDLGFYRQGVARPAAETALAPEVLNEAEPAAALEMAPLAAEEAAPFVVETAEGELAREMPAPAEADVAAADAESAPVLAPEAESAETTVQDEAAPDSTRAAFGVQGLPAGGAEPAEATPPAEPPPEPPPDETALEATDVAPTVIVVPTLAALPTAAGTLAADAVAAQATLAPATPLAGSGPSPLIFAEIGLALAVAALGLLAWLARRRA